MLGRCKDVTASVKDRLGKTLSEAILKLEPGEDGRIGIYIVK